ncbi:MAG: hypothetical protein WCX82_00410 [archaeon]
MNKILLTILGIFLLSGLVLAAETIPEQYVTVDTSNYDVQIDSPLVMNLVSDYTIIPSSIKMRTGDSISIVGGQSLISKYNFINKLDYSVIGRYELELGINDDSQLQNFGIYVADALPESECISKGGEILKYNNNRIKITNTETTNDQELYLCYTMKTMDYYLDADKLVLDMIIEPGVNSKYVLFVTTPALSFQNSSLSFEDSIKIKNSADQDLAALNVSTDAAVNKSTFGPITMANTENSEELKELNAYNNQVTYNKANPNYNSTDVITGTKTTTSTTSNTTETKGNLSDKAGILKSEATALITMTPEKGIIIGIGIIAIIGLALFVYSRKDKDLSDVH